MNCPSPATRVQAAAVLAAAALALCSCPPPRRRGPDRRARDKSPTQPFKPWLDPASYVLVPNGAVESGTGWHLSGGAARTSGNEAFYVHDEDDAGRSRLPPGSSATTAPMCVGIEHPTLRLFARNRGSVFSSLLVEVLFTTPPARLAPCRSGPISGRPRGSPPCRSLWSRTSSPSCGQPRRCRLPLHTARRRGLVDRRRLRRPVPSRLKVPRPAPGRSAEGVETLPPPRVECTSRQVIWLKPCAALLRERLAASQVLR